MYVIMHMYTLPQAGKNTCHLPCKFNFMQTDSFIDAASSSESRCKDVCLGSRKKLLFLASQAQTKDVNRKYDTYSHPQEWHKCN